MKASKLLSLAALVISISGCAGPAYVYHDHAYYGGGYDPLYAPYPSADVVIWGGGGYRGWHDGYYRHWHGGGWHHHW